MKLTIDLGRTTDTTEETWVSHCLELDTISQGRTPQEAIRAIAEAVDMMVRDEIAALESSGQIENPGWERAFANIADDVAWRDAKVVHHCAAVSALLTCGRPRTVDTREVENVTCEGCLAELRASRA